MSFWPCIPPFCPFRLTLYLDTFSGGRSQPPNTQTPVPPPTTSTEPSTTETTTTPVTETPVSTQPQGELAVHFIDVGQGDAILIDLNDIEVLIADWRREYNQVRPHSSLGYRSPAPEAKIPVTLTLFASSNTLIVAKLYLSPVIYAVSLAVITFESLVWISFTLVTQTTIVRLRNVEAWSLHQIGIYLLPIVLLHNLVNFGSEAIMMANVAHILSLLGFSIYGMLRIIDLSRRKRLSAFLTTS